MNQSVTEQPVNPVSRPSQPRKKLEYCSRNLVKTHVSELRPDFNGPEHANDFVLVGEHYIHDEWFPLRSSLIIGYDEVTRTYETRNSFYRSVD